MTCNQPRMSDLPQTRHSLLVRLQDQTSDAWSEFLAIYEQAILKYACSRGLQDADAKDVTQEVLAAVTAKVENWDPSRDKGLFRGWLFRVARNMAVDITSAQARGARPTGDSQIAQMLSETEERDGGELELFQAEYRRKVFQWAADRIRPEVRETSWKAFWRTSVDGQKPEAVAQQLNLSVGAVYAAKFRIVSRIRSIVEKFDEEQHSNDSILKTICTKR